MFFALVAHAQPVNLTCKQDGSSREGRVIFDESAQTAGFAVSGFDVHILSATFTDTEIKWVWEDNDPSRRTSFTLDRKTGTLSEVFPAWTKQNGATIWHCTVVEKKF
jgi:hypothetical protein